MNTNDTKEKTTGSESLPLRPNALAKSLEGIEALVDAGIKPWDVERYLLEGPSEGGITDPESLALSAAALKLKDLERSPDPLGEVRGQLEKEKADRPPWDQDPNEAKLALRAKIEEISDLSKGNPGLAKTRLVELILAENDKGYDRSSKEIARDVLDTGCGKLLFEVLTDPATPRPPGYADTEGAILHWVVERASEMQVPNIAETAIQIVSDKIVSGDFDEGQRHFLEDTLGGYLYAELDPVRAHEFTLRVVENTESHFPLAERVDLQMIAIMSEPEIFAQITENEDVEIVLPDQIITKISDLDDQIVKELLRIQAEPQASPEAQVELLKKRLDLNDLLGNADVNNEVLKLAVGLPPKVVASYIDTRNLMRAVEQGSDPKIVLEVWDHILAQQQLFMLDNNYTSLLQLADSEGLDSVSQKEARVLAEKLISLVDLEDESSQSKLLELFIKRGAIEKAQQLFTDHILPGSEGDISSYSNLTRAFQKLLDSSSPELHSLVADTLKQLRLQNPELLTGSLLRSLTYELSSTAQGEDFMSLIKQELLADRSGSSQVTSQIVDLEELLKLLPEEELESIKSQLLVKLDTLKNNPSFRIDYDFRYLLKMQYRLKTGEDYDFSLYEPTLFVMAATAKDPLLAYKTLDQLNSRSLFVYDLEKDSAKGIIIRESISLLITQDRLEDAQGLIEAIRNFDYHDVTAILSEAREILGEEGLVKVALELGVFHPDDSFTTVMLRNTELPSYVGEIMDALKTADDIQRSLTHPEKRQIIQLFYTDRQIDQAKLDLFRANYETFANDNEFRDGLRSVGYHSNSVYFELIKSALFSEDIQIQKDQIAAIEINSDSFYKLRQVFSQENIDNLLLKKLSGEADDEFITRTIEFVESNPEVLPELRRFIAISGLDGYSVVQMLMEDPSIEPGDKLSELSDIVGKIPPWKMLYKLSEFDFKSSIQDDEINYPIRFIPLYRFRGKKFDFLEFNDEEVVLRDLTKLSPRHLTGFLLPGVEPTSIDTTKGVPLSVLTPEVRLSAFYYFLSESVKRSGSTAEKQGADQRNRGTATAQLSLDGEYLVHGTGSEYLGTVLRYGNICGEAIETNRHADLTPMQVDLALLETPRPLVGAAAEDSLRSLVSSGYGNIDLIFNRTTMSWEKGTELPPGPYSGNGHVLMLAALPATEISAMVLKNNLSPLELNTIKHSIARNGFYIPIYDAKGQLIFSTEEYETIRVRLDRLDMIRADIDRLVSQGEFEPIELIAALSSDPELEKLYGMPAGVSEGYTLAEHTEAILGQFEKYFAGGFSSALMDAPTFRLGLALHDIGKPMSVSQTGSTTNQHTFTRDVITQKASMLGVEPREQAIMIEVFAHDFIGEMVKGQNDVGTTREAIESTAQILGVDPKELYKLMRMYYLCDASSYTGDAEYTDSSGNKVHAISSLDSVFSFGQDKIGFSETSDAKIAELEAALGLG